MKKINLTLLFITVFICKPLHAHFELGDFDLEKHVTHYNNLPSVENSDELLNKKDQFPSFLKAAEEIVVRHELESIIGLRLIHSHFNLTENQIMSEELGEIEKIPSLITYAQEAKTAQQKGAVPASWIFTQNPSEVLLFEASNDPGVKAGIARLQKSPEFFDEMHKLLINHNLVDLLSIAVVSRHNLVAANEQVFMEINDPSEKSIVQVWDINEKTNDSIKTSWSFKGPIEHRCIIETYCVPKPNNKHEKHRFHSHIEDCL